MGQRETCFTSRVSKKLNNNYFSVNYVKETPLLPLFVINIGYGWQVEQRSVLCDIDRAVDQNLTTAHVLLDFNSAQRKGFWSVRRLVCYNTTPYLTTWFPCDLHLQILVLHLVSVVLQAFQQVSVSLDLAVLRVSIVSHWDSDCGN